MSQLTTIKYIDPMVDYGFKKIFKEFLSRHSPASLFRHSPVKPANDEMNRTSG